MSERNREVWNDQYAFDVRVYCTIPVTCFCINLVLDLTSQSVCHRQLSVALLYMFRSGQIMKHFLTGYPVFVSPLWFLIAGTFCEHFYFCSSYMNYFPRLKIAA